MWIKLDDGFATHPKVLTAGPLALAIQIRAICYASQNKTDGFIPAQAVPLLLIGFEQVGLFVGHGGMDANEFDWPEYMVTHRLWDLAEEGYRIHDYLHWNMSKKQYDSMKKALSKAGKKGMKSRWSGHSSSDNQGYNQPNNKSITLQSTSKDSLKTLNSPKKGESERETDFEHFWLAYPRPVGKKDARKAWTQAKDKPGLSEILKALESAKQSEQWTKEGGKFIPHPATWLRQGRWDDKPLANGHGTRKAEIPPFPGPEDPIGRNLWRQAYGNPT